MHSAPHLGLHAIAQCYPHLDSAPLHPTGEARMDSLLFLINSSLSRHPLDAWAALGKLPALYGGGSL